MVLRRPGYLPQARIRKELAATLDRLNGVLSTLQDSAARGADLITFKLYLAPRSPWPTGSVWQKLVFFGFLPPATRVLAASVENSLYWLSDS